MAISVTAPFTCRSWTFDPATPLPSSSSSSSKLSNFSSLQSHSHLHRLTLNNRPFTAFPSKPRTLHLVQAKKQTFSSLDELLEKAEKPVLVDFYATWCGPCQFMAPILNEVSITMADTIQVVKIDTEKYPEIANKYSIEALPTFILFKDGKPFDRFEGALTANQLVQRIEDTLKAKK
ncbi:thioredoxin Y2, chloroplastic [Cynara cardunculus var. scolymus]|uniref:Thioredoxin n=1 Tax=Cynara cardunculus var. scolymus TaxID=59895 RepID=A0A103YDT7_CYNCS|nr:thioredoxin Y2, chloroplastic [Cynara cardunculus var. scolymus]KVI07254.1 Thioredoxin [Cynara cardunculus var. scolymus]